MGANPAIPKNFKLINFTSLNQPSSCTSHSTTERSRAWTCSCTSHSTTERSRAWTSHPSYILQCIHNYACSRWATQSWKLVDLDPVDCGFTLENRHLLLSTPWKTLEARWSVLCHCGKWPARAELVNCSVFCKRLKMGICKNPHNRYDWTLLYMLIDFLYCKRMHILWVNSSF